MAYKLPGWAIVALTISITALVMVLLTIWIFTRKRNVVRTSFNSDGDLVQDIFEENIWGERECIKHSHIKKE